MPRLAGLRIAIALGALGAALSACEPDGVRGEDAGGHTGKDAGRPSTVDSGTSDEDAGESPEDAGEGEEDAGPFDAGVRDGGVRDAGVRDAGVRDAGVRDAGPSGDGGWYGGASRCGAAGTLVCDGFEGAALDGTTWSRIERNGGVVSLDTTRAARGAKSVKVHTTALTGSTAFVSLRKIFPIAQNTVYGRAFVYLQGHASVIHTSFFEADGPISNGAASGAGHMRYGGPKQIIGANYDNSLCHPDYTARSTSQMPLDQWVCMEFEFNGQSHDQRFWLNGVELTAAHLVLQPDSTACTAAAGWTAAKLTPAIENLNVGFRLYHDDVAPFDLWYDEVAVDSARIGCAR